MLTFDAAGNRFLSDAGAPGKSQRNVAYGPLFARATPLSDLETHFHPSGSIINHLPMDICVP